MDHHNYLCDQCEEKAFTCSTGTCEKCGTSTTSSYYQLCLTCAEELGICQACQRPKAKMLKRLTQLALESAPKANRAVEIAKRIRRKN